MEQSPEAGSRPIRISPVRATLAALCANFVGIGIARFGYTPLIPALVAAHWFTPSEAFYLGAANLAGYLAGALGARSIAVTAGPVPALRVAMLLTAGSLFAGAFQFGFAWFFLTRFVSGGTGGVLMTLAAPTAIAVVPAARRGIAGGVIFAGVGLGIAASGTLVPLLMELGVKATWLGLAGIAGALTVLTWRGWVARSPNGQPLCGRRGRRSSIAVQALYVEYALNAVGLVPHMVFLADFVARGLGRGLAEAAGCWIIFGAGAVVGPPIGGCLGDRIGFRSTLRLAFVIQMVAVAVPAVTISRPPIALSSFVVGAFVPGVVAITIGRSRELILGDPSRQVAAWGHCTTAFALGQALAGYAFSGVFAQTHGNYAVLFMLGAAALLLALSIDYAPSCVRAKRWRSTR